MPHSQEGEKDEEGRILGAYFDRLELTSQAADHAALSAPPKLLHRSATLLYKQAAIYAREGDLQTAYTLYLRFCKLTMHTPNNMMDKQMTRRAIEELERIKPVLIEAVKLEYRRRKRSEVEDTKRKLAELRSSPALNAVKEEVKEEEVYLGMRKVRIPLSLIESFRSLAQANTANRLETCAVLAGTLARNQLNITSLILPKQHATCDTCTMTHEEELLTVQDAHDLLVLGWIHTHPTQGLFLSSVDLHTHYGFQVLIPEAVAIVLAPTARRADQRDWGVFRIINMGVVGKCTRTGFHPHALPDDQIYQDIHNDVEWATNDTEVKIFDLRK